MSRAYLRLLPDYYERKALGIRPDGVRVDPYPPAALGAMIGAICLAEHVDPRGRFKSQRVLEAMLAGPNDEGAAYAAEVLFLIEHGDLIRQPDGSLYLDGWDELQEGRDATVNDRMVRYRERKRQASPDGNAAVTRNSTVPRARVTAKSRPPLTAIDNPLEKEDRAREDAPEGPVLTWLAKHNCLIRPGNGYHQQLVTATERHGAIALTRQLDELVVGGVRDGDVKGFVFGAIDALDSVRRPSWTAVSKAAAEVSEGERFRRRVERTKREAAEIQSVGEIAGSIADHGVTDPGSPS